MKTLFAICVLVLASCSLSAQKQTMDHSTFQYFLAMSEKYQDSAVVIPAISSKVGANPVSNQNPTPPTMTSTSNGTRGSRRDLGLRQTIIFDSHGNSRLITTIRIR